MIEYATPPLAGQTALVTGASRNLGRAIALAYARAGADVIVNTRSNAAAADEVVEEIRALGRRAMPAVVDVRSAEGVAEMIARGHAELGPVTLLVCNAAMRSRDAMRDMTREHWDEAITSVLDGAYNCIKGVIEDMVAAGSGRIIGISGDGPHTALGNHAHVSAAKFGLEGLIRSLATEVGPFGITANIISPGVLKAENQKMTDFILDGLKRTPIGRLLEVGEVADLCVFLSLPQSGYLTSQTIHPSGGKYSGY